MDKQTACKILNLDSTASFADAKKAYRHLAKQYHPDIAQSKTGISDDRQMKEINLAFFYLAPILRAKKATIESSEWNQQTNNPTPKTEPAKRQDQKSKSDLWQIFFPNLFEKIAAFIQSVVKIQEETEKSHIVKTSRQSSGSSRKVSSGKKSFDQVFSSLNGNLPPRPTKDTRETRNLQFSQKKRSYQGYQAYLELKKKMSATKKRQSQNFCITPVEKIEPVRPVNPVQRG
ncbi:MAG: DnaJ domain-containing protein [Pseudomonadota bacterium]